VPQGTRRLASQSLCARRVLVDPTAAYPAISKTGSGPYGREPAGAKEDPREDVSSPPMAYQGRWSQLMAQHIADAVRRERPPVLIEMSAASSREISRNDRSPPLGRLLAVRSPPAWPVLNTPRGSISSQAD
jgi:hypothetical protein